MQYWNCNVCVALCLNYIIIFYSQEDKDKKSVSVNKHGMFPGLQISIKLNTDIY